MTGGTTAFIDATSRRVVEIDADGAVVWHVRIFGDLGVRERDGVYKAVRVSK